MKLWEVLLAAKQGKKVASQTLSRFAWGEMHVLDIAIKDGMQAQKVGKETPIRFLEILGNPLFKEI